MNMNTNNKFTTNNNNNGNGNGLQRLSLSSSWLLRLAITTLATAIIVATGVATPSITLGAVGGVGGVDQVDEMPFINSRAKAKRNNVPYYRDIISTTPMGYISRRESVMIMREEGEFYYVEVKDKAHVYVRKSDVFQVVNLYQERISPQGYNKKAYYEIRNIIDRFDNTFNRTYFNAMPTAPYLSIQSVRSNRSSIKYTILYSGINNKGAMHPSIATNPFRDDMLAIIEIVMLKLAQHESNKEVVIDIVVPKFEGAKRAAGVNPYFTITLPKELIKDNSIAIHILKDISVIWNYADYSGDYFQMFQTYPN